MATIAPVPAKKEYPLIPEGTHVGIIYKFMNMGTRYQEYKGALKDYPDTLISFTIEIPDAQHEFTFKKEDGTEEKVMKPLVITKEMTLSMGSKSKLRPFVEGVIGTRLSDDEAAAFDVETLVGKACLVSIVHRTSKEGRVYANINATSPLIKGMEVPQQYNKNDIFDVNLVSEEQIDALPEWIKEKVIVSDEYKKRFSGLTEEDVPF